MRICVSNSTSILSNTIIANIMQWLNRLMNKAAIAWSYIKLTPKIEDFDFDSILTVQAHQIKRIIKCFEKSQETEDCAYDVSRMKLALSLLKIYRNSETEGDAYVNLRNRERYLPNWNSEPEKQIMIADTTPDGVTWRPLGPEDGFHLPSSDETLKSCLREEKAWALYNRCLQQYQRGWWA